MKVKVQRDSFGLLTNATGICEECGQGFDMLENFFYGLFKCPYCETVYSLSGEKIAFYGEKEVTV